MGVLTVLTAAITFAAVNEEKPRLPQRFWAEMQVLLLFLVHPEMPSSHLIFQGEGGQEGSLLIVLPALSRPPRSLF